MLSGNWPKHGDAPEDVGGSVDSEATDDDDGTLGGRKLWPAWVELSPFSQFRVRIGTEFETMQLKLNPNTDTPWFHSKPDPFASLITPNIQF